MEDDYYSDDDFFDEDGAQKTKKYQLSEKVKIDLAACDSSFNIVFFR